MTDQPRTQRPRLSEEELDALRKQYPELIIQRRWVVPDVPISPVFCNVKLREHPEENITKVLSRLALSLQMGDFDGDVAYRRRAWLPIMFPEVTPREAKRQYTNRYNGMNRNGLPCKRGKR